MSIVVARLFGGIGNQLFIYAAGRRLALASDSELSLDDRSGFTCDSVYQRKYQLNHFSIPVRLASPQERLEPFSRLRRRWLMRRDAGKPFEQRRYIVQEGVDFDPRLLLVRPRGTVFLEGYWQGEGYFQDVADTIRSDLIIAPPQDADNQRMSLAIHASACPVAVHLRFFEPQSPDSQQHAPPGYYQRALEEIESKVAVAHFFIFSDRPDLAQSSCLFPAERTTYVTHNQGDEAAYADLWLMTQCRHHIIANSTFSWWGAWLANQPDKIVIAPGFERREGVAWWGFKGLIPETWITC